MNSGFADLSQGFFCILEDHHDSSRDSVCGLLHEICTFNQQSESILKGQHTIAVKCRVFTDTVPDKTIRIKTTPLQIMIDSGRRKEYRRLCIFCLVDVLAVTKHHVKKRVSSLCFKDLLALIHDRPDLFN